MRVVVTGATGFIGNAVVTELIKRGETVVAVSRQTQPKSDQIEWVQADLNEGGSLGQAIKGEVDWVIHAAGKLGEAGIPEAVYEQIHFGGTKEALQFAQERGGSFLHVSSAGVLGPMGERIGDESFLVAPSNMYERSKAKAEQIVGEFASAGLQAIIIRPEFVYGPGDLHVLGLFQAIQNGRFFYINGGDAYCHPTYIDDVVAGIMLGMEKGEAGSVYQIVGSEPVSFKQFGETIAQTLGVISPKINLPEFLVRPLVRLMEFVGGMVGIKPPLSETGVDFFTQSRRFHWDKAKSELGYAPQIDLTEGMKRTVRWYREKGLLK